MYTNPCKSGARYRRYAFIRDDDNRFMEITTLDNGLKAIKIGGPNPNDDYFIRTIVPNVTVSGGNDGYSSPDPGNLVPDGRYEICSRPEQELGGRIRIHTLKFDELGVPELEDDNVTLKYTCVRSTFFGSIPGNPPVNFDVVPPNTIPIEGGSYIPVLQDIFGADEILQLTQDLSQDDCQEENFASYGVGERVVVGVTTANETSGTYDYWIYTATHDLKTNDLSSPLLDGGKASVVKTKNSPDEDVYGTVCANAERTFINENFCQISYDACTKALDINDGAELHLTNATFKAIHTITGGGVGGTNTRYIYRMDGLQQGINDEDEPPCKKGARSRWIQIPVDECDERGIDIDEQTYDLFHDLLRNSFDSNRYLRDIYFPKADMIAGQQIKCHDDDVDAIDFSILVDDECWLNTHVDNYNVYDMTPWTKLSDEVDAMTESHNGNSGTRNPIKEFAEGRAETAGREGMEATFHFVFPFEHPINPHGMNRWKLRGGNAEKLGDIGPYIGRYGDTVQLKSLPDVTRTKELEDAFAGSSGSNPQGPYLVCGSPFEVANDHSKDSSGLYRGGFEMLTRYNRTVGDGDLRDQRETTWMEIAMNSEDQLRQRIAWALYQILVVSPDSIGNIRLGEAFMHYYDIFVRHAFGNYFDILKEVTTSPVSQHSASDQFSLFLHSTFFIELMLAWCFVRYSSWGRC